MGFKDHFSGHADAYARFRPTYPRALFRWLAEASPGREHAWDAGTGNGQVALGLAERFDAITATDASAEQIGLAQAHPRVTYRTARAEASDLPDGSVDLVTVGQALHWFDIAAFFEEARRALRPGGVIAVWSYGLMEISPPVDAVVHRLYTDIVGPWWPPERALVESGYAGIPFPFEAVEAPSFAMTAEWELRALIGYLGTWSASRRYLAARDADPLDGVRAALTEAWGDPTEPSLVRWPLAMRVGRT